MSESADLARLLNDLRDDYPRLSPLLSRAARCLIETDPAPTPAGVCRRCGRPLAPYPGRGRPRLDCAGCSPQKKARKSML